MWLVLRKYEFPSPMTLLLPSGPLDVQAAGMTHFMGVCETEEQARAVADGRCMVIDLDYVTVVASLTEKGK